MKIITVFETFDGVRHDSSPFAKKHLDSLYNHHLLSVAHKLVQEKSLDKMVQVLDENLKCFMLLHKIRDDMLILSVHNYQPGEDD